MMILVITSSSAVAAVGDRDHCKSIVINEICCTDDFKMKIDDGDIIFKSRDNGNDEVVISSDYKLFINGERIETNDDQERLLEEFHVQTFDLIDAATDIGMKGAKIGVKGAAIGSKAVLGLVKAMFTSYELEDLEEDLEYEADKLEIEAEKLEEQAEILENMADELENLQADLRDDIPELDELHWF
jgi:hypothetical protein